MATPTRSRVRLGIAPSLVLTLASAPVFGSSMRGKAVGRGQ